MDKSKMKPVTIEWLANNQDDAWRQNAIYDHLPRAFINVGTIGESWHEIMSVIDPLPDWVVDADGLYTVWLTDDDTAPLDLEGNHQAWLDFSDVQPVGGVFNAEPTDSPTPTPQTINVPGPLEGVIEVNFTDAKILITIEAVNVPYEVLREIRRIVGLENIVINFPPMSMVESNGLTDHIVDPEQCPSCGSPVFDYRDTGKDHDSRYAIYHCNTCPHEWRVDFYVWDIQVTAGDEVA